jgi:hypothetical protein
VRYQYGVCWAVAFGGVPIFYLSKSHIDSRRAKRFLESLIIVPAVYLALQQHPAARSITLLSLGRKRGCVLAKAMEGDRDIRCQNAHRGRSSRDTRPVRRKHVRTPNRLSAHASRASEMWVRYASPNDFAIAASASTNRAIRSAHILRTAIDRIGGRVGYPLSQTYSGIHGDGPEADFEPAGFLEFKYVDRGTTSLAT